MVDPVVQRFEVWLVQLDPTKGSEIRKIRPCIIIFSNEMASLKTAIIAPLMTKGFLYPTRISCTFQKKKGLILLDRIRTVDKLRLIRRIGVISRNTQLKIVNCLQELFAL